MQPFGSLRKPNSTTFGDFVREIVQVSTKREIRNPMKLTKILKERGDYLLNLVG